MVFRASGSFQDAEVHGQGTRSSQSLAWRVLLVRGSSSGSGSVEEDADADAARFLRTLVGMLPARRRDDSTFDSVKGGCRCRCRPVVGAGAVAGLDEVALLLRVVMAVGVRDID
jgi:hypothetical protein